MVYLCSNSLIIKYYLILHLITIMQKACSQKGAISITAAKYIILCLFIVILLGLGVFYIIIQKPTPAKCTGDNCFNTNSNTDIFSRNKPTYGSSTNSYTPSGGNGLSVDSITKSPFGIFTVFSANTFELFMKKNSLTNESYLEWADNHMKNIGAHWTRSNMQLRWDIIQPTIGGEYIWNNETLTDQIIKSIYSSQGNINWLGVFHEGNASRNPLNYESEYSAFVKAAVERYDGDGSDDASSEVKVKYWQVGNEVMTWDKTGRSVFDYENLVRLISKAVKSADSEAKIVLLAPTDGRKTDSFLVQVINDLASEKVFDVIDIHQWGQASNWKMTAVPEYRTLLDSKGLKNVEIWSGENGTWNGKPRGAQVLQTESDQASSLIKRYVYNLANGLDKLMWNNMVEWENFNNDTSSIYNSMGLIADGVGGGEDTTMNNMPRLSYYTYKLMTSKLEGTNWDKIEKIGESDNLYAYLYPKTNGKNVWVMWWEDQNSIASSYPVSFAVSNMSEVIITRAIPRYISGKYVTDFSSAFEYTRVKVVNGKVDIKLIPGEGPVYIEDASKANIIGKEVVSLGFSTDYNRVDQLSTMIPQSAVQQQTQGGVQKPAGTNTKPGVGVVNTNPKCGDGVCDAIETKNKAICPQDCR